MLLLNSNILIIISLYSLILQLSRLYNFLMKDDIKYKLGRNIKIERIRKDITQEEFAEMMGGHDDIWYATNIEIVDYNKVFDRLQFAADNSFVYNPSAASAWLCINNTQIVEVKGGTLVHLS